MRSRRYVWAMKITLLFLLLTQATLAFAGLKDQFTKTYGSHYVEGKCGLNILNLLDRSEADGDDIYNAHVLEITNEGFSVFGLVNAEWARGAAARGTQPGERNWYHHVVLEDDGLIYDFDFANEATVLPVKEYFEKMFLEEKKGDGWSSGTFYVGREDKLKTYKIVVRPGKETLEAHRSRKPSPEKQTLKLGEYLSSF